MDKKQAAEYLGISTRTLERWVKDGKVRVRYEQGNNGEVAIFDAEELESIKDEKQIVRIKPATRDIISDSTPDSLEIVVGGTVAPGGGFLAPLIRPFSDFAERLFSSPALLQGKILLNLNEAQVITGLSKNILMTAIKNGELESQIMGKAYRIKRKELDRYVDDLWN